MGIAGAMEGESAPIDDLFAAAVRHHQAGRLNEAKDLYWHILNREPRHADSLHLLGVVAHQAQRHDLAVDLIGQAVAIDPSVAPYHLNLGTVHKDGSRLEEAIACYRRALDLRPDYAEAHNNLGTVLDLQGRRDAAAASYRQAIELKPDYAEAHNNLGNALHAQGQLHDAIALYRRAIALNPESAEVHNNLGNALQQFGWLDEAVACYHRALEIRPDYPDAHNNLGNAMAGQGRLDEAVAAIRRALELRPDYPAAHRSLELALQAQQEMAAGCRAPDDPIAHNNLGNAFQQQGRLDEAIDCYHRAIALRPDYPEVYSNLGNALQQQAKLEEAVDCYRRALELRPDYPEAYVNLSNAMRDLGRPVEAAECCRRALELRPNYPTAHSNLALALLAQGDMAAGWPEYEWRWHTMQMVAAHRSFAQPQWRGEDGQGRTLLIHAEQGLGDTLQFCRYAPLVAARGLRVVMQVQDALVRLVRDLPGVAAVVGYSEKLPPFDLHCPMLSLPLAMGTTVETIPAATPYLHADPAQVAGWRARLAAMGDRGPLVGLAWAGNPRTNMPFLTSIDRRRSIAPERLAPLFAVPGLRFVSVQKDGPKAPENYPLTDFMDEMTDFADTAALVANLDLVVTVDTAIVHLAGALGKPVWMLDRFDTCWRWLQGRRDSPWYPALRLYRQTQPGDWESVLAEVADDLRRFAQAT
jgi:tetratricopeptide (TPR) repeat protein